MSYVLILYCNAKIGWVLAGIHGLDWTRLEEGREEEEMNVVSLRLF